MIRIAYSIVVLSLATGCGAKTLDQTGPGASEECEPGSWTTEALAIGTGGSQIGASIAVDKRGTVHASYYDKMSSTLKYTHKTEGGAWQAAETIDPSVAGFGYHPSLAIDENDELHVAYVAYPGPNQRRLKYAYKPVGGAWQPATLNALDDVSYPSLSTDSSGGVHVVYRNDTTDVLEYFEKTSTGIWLSAIKLDPSGWESSLRVDRNGGVHVSYLALVGSAHDLKYIYRPMGGAWQSPRTVDKTGDSSGRSSLEVDDDGGVHVSYVGAGPDAFEINYAYMPAGGDWQGAVMLDSSSKASGATSLAIGPDNGVHVIYSHFDVDGDNGELRDLYKPSGKAWSPPIAVDLLDDPSWYSSVVIDANGGAHLSYYDFVESASQGALKHAFRARCE